VEDLADLGAPVPRAVAAPRAFGGALWLLMQALPGWSHGYRPSSDSGYRRMGRDLARLHDRIERLAPRAQRPGWGSFVDAAWPLSGGREHRDGLLADLRAVDAEAAGAYARALEAFEARDLPGVFADAPRHAIHGDVSPWNLRYRKGEVSAVLDFELAHVDVLAVDLACARRGYHDAVVEGYLQHRALPEPQIAALDALWLGGIFHGLWRELEAWRRTGEPRPERLTGWSLQQLAKIRPYRPA
jgi:Ser/Thr protein kinase RdoA (MazF antagonist)